MSVKKVPQSVGFGTFSKFQTKLLNFKLELADIILMTIGH